jgi:transposase-like protein
MLKIRQKCRRLKHDNAGDNSGDSRSGHSEKTVCFENQEEAGRLVLEQFGEKWQSKYPLIYKSWDANWQGLCGFFKYP